MVQRFPDSYLALRALGSFYTRKLTLSLQMLDCTFSLPWSISNDIRKSYMNRNRRIKYSCKVKWHILSFAKCASHSASHSKPYDGPSAPRLRNWTSRLTPLAVYFIFLESVEVSCQHGNVETASKNPQQQAPFSHCSDTWEINLHGCTMVSRCKNGKFELSQATSDFNRASWKGSMRSTSGIWGKGWSAPRYCGVLQARDCLSYHPCAHCSQACSTTPSHLPFMMFIPVSLSISSNLPSFLHYTHLTLNFSCFGIPNLHQYTRAETQPVAAFCLVSPEESECCIYVESGGTCQNLRNAELTLPAILFDILNRRNIPGSISRYQHKGSHISTHKGEDEQVT